ncbi:Leucine rich repeat [Carpediemonas membranifera]|uniref:Leucine rich repeat n=1 Tax=Carpediemonas membranifera TaxID=201153 RepID=A0A8J6AV46_9EUKA|nr:Leucine rich repeat [Carpediemonas membranifera]|eukprot:KAG9394963.1 Leucine rich repeat [Carpediemonas membranifera]
MILSEEWIIRTLFVPNSAVASPLRPVNSHAIGTIRTLDLSDMFSRTGGKIESIGRSLQRFRSIQVLSLADNDLTDLKGIEHCQQIKELDISKNQLHRIESLDALRYLPNLVKLDFRQNPYRLPSFILEKLDAKLTTLQSNHKLPISFVNRLRGGKRTKKQSVLKAQGLSEPRLRSLLLVRIFPRLHTLNGKPVTSVEQDAAPLVWDNRMLKMLQAGGVAKKRPATGRLRTPSLAGDDSTLQPARRFWEGVALGTHRAEGYDGMDDEEGMDEPSPRLRQSGVVDRVEASGVEPTPAARSMTQSPGRMSPSPSSRETLWRLQELERQVTDLKAENSDLQLIMKKKDGQIQVLTAKHDYLLKTNEELLAELDEMRAKSRDIAQKWSGKFTEMRDALRELIEQPVLSPPKASRAGSMVETMAD